MYLYVCIQTAANFILAWNYEVVNKRGLGTNIARIVGTLFALLFIVPSSVTFVQRSRPAPSASVGPTFECGTS